MRLLYRDVDGLLHLTKELGCEVPPYAILSHTWGDDDEEVVFQDIQQGIGHSKSGYQKLEFCEKQAARDGFNYFWVDTCCIDKSNSTELAEAINSMFRWYRDSAVCYVYLQDVTNQDENNTKDTKIAEPSWTQSFCRCRWLGRGWTLQELIAPKSVVFFNAGGQRLGNKENIIDLLEQITKIPAAALRGKPLSTFSIEERMSWRQNRQTKRGEDRVYSMLGIFDVYLPLLYGEGEQRAESRLLEEVHKRSRGYYDHFKQGGDLSSDHSLSVFPMRTQVSLRHNLVRTNDIDETRDLFQSAKAQVERIVSAADFGIQSSIMISQFEADKRLFSQWGEEADLHAGECGLERIFGDDIAGTAAVRETLVRITKVIGTASNSNNRQEQLEASTKDFTASNRQVDQKSDGTHMKCSPLTQKVRFVAMAQQFRALVEQLYHLTWQGSTRMVLPVHPARRQKPGGLADKSSQFHTQKLIWEEIEKQIQRDMRRELETWLDGFRSSAMYDDVLHKKLTGTCDWILERGVFQQWKLEISSLDRAKLLWITGPAGYGKTVLSGSIIQHLQGLSWSPFYFFFSADLGDRSDPFIVFRSWISQLVSSSQDAFNAVWDELGVHVAGKASNRQIVALFKKLVVRIPNCIFIVDGLDECTEKTGWAGLESRSLASFVLTLVEAVAGSTSRALIVSREHEDIRDGLSSVLPESSLLELTEYKISEEDVRPDATLLSQSIVGRKLSNKPQTVQNEIAQKMVHRSNSMLLHIKLLENDLRGGKNQKQLERILSQAPDKLATLYDRNWQRIMENDTDRDRALAILRWATFAQRSITVNEITEALLAAGDNADESLQDNMPDAIDEEFIKTEILDLCHSLVEARTDGSSQDIGSRTIHLTHFTVREYLLQRDPVTGTASTLHANDTLQRTHESEHNLLLADVCLRYLKLTRLWDIDSCQQQDCSEENRVDQGRFRDYAAIFWRRHIQPDSPQYLRVFRSAIDFFCACDQAWESWRRHYDESPMTSSHVKYKGELATANRLFYAVYLGFVDLVRYMVEEANFDVNFVDSSKRTALFAAAAQGHVMLTGYLLSKNADADMAAEDMDTPLIVACRLGHLEVVRKLVEEAPQHLNVIRNEMTPILAASIGPHLEVVQLLIGKGADPNTTSWEGWVPLHFAAWRGDVEVVEFLLGHGADPNLVVGPGADALYYAACSGNIEVVKLLLDRGAKHNALNIGNRTCLWGSALNGHAEVVRFLLDKGADHSVTCGENESTAVGVAAGNGHAAAVRLLLDKGADYNIANKNGWTPLGYAAEGEHAEVVKLLLEAGADLDASFDNAGSLLNWAAGFGRIEMAGILLMAGADFSLTDTVGATALCRASRAGHSELAKLLIEHGANFDINTDDGLKLWNDLSDDGCVDMLRLLIRQNNDMSPVPAKAVPSPLHHAAMNGQLETIQLLLDSGASLTAREMSGNLPLHYAAYFGYNEAVRLLVEKGADISAKNDLARTALFYAAYGGMKADLDVLFHTATEVSKTDIYGATPLAVAAHAGQKDVVEYLLSLPDVDARTPDHFGRTALSWARREGHVAIVELLASKLEATDSSAGEVDDQSGENAAASGGGRRVCDVCMASTVKVVFHCGICCNAEFDMCKYCKDVGAHCIDPSHNLLEQHLD